MVVWQGRALLGCMVDTGIAVLGARCRYCNHYENWKPSISFIKPLDPIQLILGREKILTRISPVKYRN